MATPNPAPTLAWRDKLLAAGVVVVLACTLALVSVRLASAAPSSAGEFRLLLRSLQALVEAER